MADYKKVVRVTVRKKVWGPNDTFLVVEVAQQVFEFEGFKEGDQVKITIERE